jgi:hypothetical protein
MLPIVGSSSEVWVFSSTYADPLRNVAYPDSRPAVSREIGQVTDASAAAREHHRGVPAAARSRGPPTSVMRSGAARARDRSAPCSPNQ